MTAVEPPPIAPGTFLCPRCGTALRDEQTWCLECGFAARTRIHPPPSWRIPVAVTLALAVLLAAGLAFALVALLDEREAPPAPTTITVPATAPPAAPAPATTVPTPATPPAATVPPVTVPPTATVPGGAAAPDAEAPADGD